MALIERGLDTNSIKDDRLFLDTMKYGMALVGAGLGFFIGILLESSGYFRSDIEMPLYFAPIFICSGLSLIIFYRVFRERFKE